MLAVLVLKSSFGDQFWQFWFCNRVLEVNVGSFGFAGNFWKSISNGFVLEASFGGQCWQAFIIMGV